jgi:hypothetical protein
VLCRFALAFHSSLFINVPTAVECLFSNTNAYCRRFRMMTPFLPEMHILCMTVLSLVCLYLVDCSKSRMTWLKCRGPENVLSGMLLLSVLARLFQSRYNGLFSLFQLSNDTAKVVRFHHRCEDQGLPGGTVGRSIGGEVRQGAGGNRAHLGLVPSTPAPTCLSNAKSP